MSSSPRPFWSNRWVVAVLVAVAYFMLARVGLAVALPGEQKASPVWPPAGVGLAAVLLYGRSAVAGVFAGAFASYCWDAFSPGSAHGVGAHLAAGGGMAAGSAAQAVAGAWLLRRWADGPRAVDRVAGVFRFVGVAPVACLTAATAGAGCLYAAGFVPGPAVPVVWLTWWLGDTTGVVLGVPLVLAWARPGRRSGPPRPAEAGVLGGLLAAVCLGVFGEAFGPGELADPLAYLTVPFLVWAAVRFGQRGAAVALVGVAGAAVAGTAAGAGPFVRPRLHESLLLLDVFLGVVATTALVLAAVLTEQQRGQAALAFVQAQLREANARLRGQVADRTADLRASEERFRAFTDNSPAVCFMKDEGGRYAYLSRTFEARFAIRAEDWLGKTDADIWPADLAEQFLANDRAALASGAPLEVVERVADPDGTVHAWRTFKFAFEGGDGRRYVGGTAVDITDQQRAEEALRASEEEFRRLFENSPIGIYRTTPDGRILMANPAAVRLAGCDSFEQAAARNLEADGPHSGYDRGEFRRRLEADGQITGLEAVWPGNGGPGRAIRENARVVRGPGGGVRYYEGTMEDVTDRRRAEETLRVLFDRSSDAHLLFDEAWGIFDANPAAAALLGLAGPADLLGRHPAEFSPPVQPDGRLSMEKCVEMDGLARANGSHRFDWQHVRADGSEFPCEVTLTPVVVGGRSALLAVWHDLTDRQRAEEAMRAGEERLRVALDAARMGSWEFDVRTGRLTWDARQEELYGFAPGEFDGRVESCVGRVHPADRGRLHRATAEAAAGGGTFEVEHRVVLAGGAERWLVGRGRGVAGADGGPGRVLGIVQDVTDRKQAEEALRASEERFRAAMEGSLHAVFFLTADRGPDGAVADFVFADLNGKGEQLVTRPRAEVVGRRLCELLPVNRTGGFFAKYARVVETGETLEEEFPIAADGIAAGWLHHQVVRVGDGVAITSQDITARKRAEAALRASEDQFRTVVEQATDAIFLIAPGSVIADVNHRACESLGYARAELVGMAVADLDPQLTPAAGRAVAAEVEAGRAVTLESRHRRKDGTTFPVEVRVGPITTQGGFHHLALVRDITARKATEDALRQSEERFRRAFDSSGIGMALAAADGRLVQVNPALGRMLGYAPAELVGRTFQDVTHPDDLAANLGPLADALGGRRDSYRLEKRYRHRGGHVVWAELTVAVMPAAGEDGAVLVGQVQDITARKQAEDALRASQERFELAVRGSRDGLWDWDLTTDEVYFSPAWKGMLGYADAEVPNRLDGWERLVHPDDLPRAAAALAAYFDRTAPAYGLEVRMRHKDGSYRWIYTRGEAVRDAAGRPLRMAGSHSDVTDRKAAEDALRFQHALLDCQNEASPDGVLVVDPEHRILSHNRRFLQVWDIPAGLAAAGDDPPVLALVRTRAADPDGFAARVAAIYADPDVRAHEEVALADGRTLDRYTGPIRAATGELLGRFWNFRDITDRKRAEDELRAARAAAEGASRAKSEFLANMSHEIRTPMNGILGMTDLVLDTPLAPDQRDFLRLVRESGTNLLRIINDVLDFSKVEAGRLELEREPFRLRDAVCRTVEPLAVRAAQKGVGLAVRIAPGVPDRLTGDAGRFGQVLVNLVGNAIKFTDAGGVTVAVGCDPAAAGGGVELRVSVADTGIGIPPAHRATIFEAFVQADSSLTRKYGGTGLGLAISARLVQLMGGRIWVESEEGAGSTFHFTARLPAADGAGESADGLVWVAAGAGETRPPDRLPAPGSADAPPPLAPAGRRLRVLVAEDQPVNQKLVERMLANRGHSSVVVGDGRQALDRLAVERFDVVLMDVQMPVLDGLAATAALRDRERGAGRYTPVIALTAHALTGDRERCLAAGCDEYLSKPVSKGDLYPLLEAVAERAAGAAAPSWVDPPAAEAGPAAPAFDRPAALGRVNGDAAFLAELVEMFLDRWPAQRADLRAAVAGGNAVAVGRQAHTLKGTLAALGGTAAVAAAAAVDRAARAGTLDGAAGLVEDLEREVGRFAEAAGAVAVSSAVL